MDFQLRFYRENPFYLKVLHPKEDKKHYPVLLLDTT